jgi:hypothetical protein
VEYGQAEDVFVNGYYAMLSKQVNGGVAHMTVDGTQRYRSYAFTYEGYKDDTSNGYGATGYYTSTSNEAEVVNWYTSTNVSSVTSSTAQAAVNSSYEYVRGRYYKGVTFNKIINVIVSAFNSSDATFTVYTQDYTVGSDGYAKSTWADQTFDYAIGDPRIYGGFTYDDTHNTTSYEYTENRLYDYLVYCAKVGSDYRRYVKSWGNMASEIKVGGTTTAYDNIIAPSFKIQSTIGSSSVTAYYDVAKKRCATYQEAGYPAGRWRLPTLAEVAFVVSLQEKDVIQEMFYSSDLQGYWISSGGSVALDSDYGTMYYRNYKDKPKASATASASRVSNIRCVYDTWYWGDTPESDTTVYTPKPTL